METWGFANSLTTCQPGNILNIYMY